MEGMGLQWLLAKALIINFADRSRRPREANGSCAAGMNRRRLQRVIRMKALPAVKNIIIDEANEVTYVVEAARVLTDGEVFSAIRLALLLRGGKRPGKGETLEIATSRWN